ncbi:TlpA disulfide reductase family protein [Xanthomarina sp. F1114]|uniref:TlpA family protein disulfide reductase n=1 Tax=Xanthomarina sp. F1114 TaxID=2996019 RepID=UPI00225E4AE1|nr:TlpA disulfide reductase family protein [Xanthomarina sp. F1114]MCX7548298.1 TlpA disulfide reductase family protein [Xanthomarina sp. F1114]
MKTETKKSLIQYAIFAAIALTLYLTGLHTEVIGFAQRGMLATGIMKPDLSENTLALNSNTKADLNFKLVNSKGETIHMQDLKGKVIFMNVWATWCPPCVAEMPGINNLSKSMENENVAFIMLSYDKKFETAKKYKENKGFNFDVHSLQSPLPDMFTSRGIPATYVIDARGELALTHIGIGDYDTDEFREFLKSLM